MAGENSLSKSRKEKLLVAAFLAGLGGTLPTLCRLAGLAATDDSLSFVSLGHFLAIGLYFLIALILCLGLQERRGREAFVLGIAAPALITNFITGTTVSSQFAAKRQVTTSGLISSAYAAETPLTLTSESEVVTDFKRALGFATPTYRDLSARQAIEQELKALRKDNEFLKTRIEVDKAHIAKLQVRPVSCPVTQTKESLGNERVCREKRGPDAEAGKAQEVDVWKLSESVYMGLLARHLALLKEEEAEEMAEMALRTAPVRANKLAVDRLRDDAWRLVQLDRQVNSWQCEVMYRYGREIRFASLLGKDTDGEPRQSSVESDQLRASMQARRHLEASLQFAQCSRRESAFHAKEAVKLYRVLHR